MRPEGACAAGSVTTGCGPSGFPPQPDGPQPVAATIYRACAGCLRLSLRLRFVPESRMEVEHRSYDAFGAFSITAGLVALVYGIIKSTQWHWSGGDAHKTYETLGLAAVLLVAFVVTELRHRAPLVRLGIFRKRSLTIANISMLLTACGVA